VEKENKIRNIFLDFEIIKAGNKEKIYNINKKTRKNSPKQWLDYKKVTKWTKSKNDVDGKTFFCYHWL